LEASIDAIERIEVCANGDRFAHVAQLVEHVLGKDEVIGSIPIVGSRKRDVV
jgi:hypothetical protein